MAEEALDRVRPVLLQDEVYVQLVDVRCNTVEVKLIDAWTGCPW